jgi:DNA-binding PadR family transcriptional regulator
MVYDVLATLWEGPSNDLQVARAIEDRLGTPCSRRLADDHLRILRTCGFVATRDAGGSPSYVLTPDGSALLARLAASIDPTENP